MGLAIIQSSVGIMAFFVCKVSNISIPYNSGIA
jgi:hypothetical protein